MKKTFLLSVLIPAVLFGAVSCGGDSANDKPANAENPAAKAPEKDENDPEVFGRKLTELLIAGDHQSIDQLIISPDAMKKAIASSSVPANGKEAAISRADSEVMKMHSEIRAGVDTVRSLGTRNGLAWENATVKQVIPQVDKSRGFEMLRLKCIVECNGVESYFTVTDIVGTDNGWKLAGYFFYGDAPVGK
jgi:hypothetical protein